MRQDIKVGIITACYNGGRYMEEYINGIMSQTYKPTHCAIVDDNSTDNSWYQIVKFIGKRSGKSISPNEFQIELKFNGIIFRLKRLKKNGGPSKARNEAIKLLYNDVEIFAVYDIDDWYKPEKIEKSLIAMSENPHAGLIYSDYSVYNEANDTLTREYKEPFDYNRLVQECIVSNNSIYTKNVLDKIGLYDESIRGPEDYDMWLRMAEKCMIYHVPEDLYTYRVSGENLTIKTDSKEFAKQVQKVKNKIAERQNARS